MRTTSRAKTARCRRRTSDASAAGPESRHVARTETDGDLGPSPHEMDAPSDAQAAPKKRSRPRASSKAAPPAKTTPPRKKLKQRPRGRAATLSGSPLAGVHIRRRPPLSAAELWTAEGEAGDGADVVTTGFSAPPPVGGSPGQRRATVVVPGASVAPGAVVMGSPMDSVDRWPPSRQKKNPPRRLVLHTTADEADDEGKRTARGSVQELSVAAAAGGASALPPVEEQAEAQSTEAASGDALGKQTAEVEETATAPLPVGGESDAQAARAASDDGHGEGKEEVEETATAPSACAASNVGIEVEASVASEGDGASAWTESAATAGDVSDGATDQPATDAQAVMLSPVQDEQKVTPRKAGAAKKRRSLDATFAAAKTTEFSVDEVSELMAELYQEQEEDDRGMYNITTETVREQTAQCERSVEVEELSLEDFRRLLTYGEVSVESVSSTILPFLELGADDVLYDLGCGTGKILVQAVLQTKCAKAVGIELMQNRVQEGLRALERLDARGLALLANKTVQLVQGDICRPPATADMSDATVVFINNVMFGPTLMLKVMHQLESIPNLKRIVTLRKVCERHRHDKCHRAGNLCASYVDPPHKADIFVSWASKTQVYMYERVDFSIRRLSSTLQAQLPSADVLPVAPSAAHAEPVHAEPVAAPRAMMTRNQQRVAGLTAVTPPPVRRRPGRPRTRRQ